MKILTILLFISLSGYGQFSGARAVCVGKRVPTIPDYMNLQAATALQNYTSNSAVIAAFGSLVIENKHFFASPGGSPGNVNLLTITGCSGVIVRNCFFDIASGGTDGNRGLVIDGSTNVQVYNNVYYNEGQGIYATNTLTNLHIYNNEFIDMRGPFPLGQAIQVYNTTSAGIVIENNRCENFLTESNPEDVININKSSGTTGEPLLIQNNQFRGGGFSKSGGGVVAGDNMGSNITIQNNKFVDVGNYSCGIVGGDNNKILGNLIYQNQRPWSNTGIIAANSNTSCTNVIVDLNFAHVTNSAGSSNPTAYNSSCSGTRNAPTDITLAAMNFPTRLITYITEDQLWTLRALTKGFESAIVAKATASPNNYTAASVCRPTADAGSDQTTSGTSVTLTSGSSACSGNSIASYNWVQVSGPATATIASATSSSTSVTGLVVGTYRFRLEVMQQNTATSQTFHSAWVNVTKN